MAHNCCMLNHQLSASKEAFSLISRELFSNHRPTFQSFFFFLSRLYQFSLIDNKRPFLKNLILHYSYASARMSLQVLLPRWHWKIRQTDMRLGIKLRDIQIHTSIRKITVVWARLQPKQEIYNSISCPDEANSQPAWTGLILSLFHTGKKLWFSQLTQNWCIKDTIQ